jgi:hypothetical protein
MKVRILFLALVFFNGYSIAQEPVKADTLIKQLDSLQQKQIDSGKATINTNPAAYNKKTTLGFKTYFLLLGSNLKQQFTSPFHATKKDWLKVGAFAGAIAVLTLADKPVSKWVSNVTRDRQGIITTSKYLTNISGTYETITLSAIGGYAFIVNNQKLKTTTLLATQAYLTGAVVETALKFLSGRRRPNFYNADGTNSNRFYGPFAKGHYDIQGNKINSSFPSGHATVAFAAATVFAREYKDTKWVPIVSYSAASLIGLSRLTENKHWITDVLAGAVLGFLTGRQIVNNYHRYQLIQSGELKEKLLKNKRRNQIVFQMGNVQGKMLPGIAYKFN